MTLRAIVVVRDDNVVRRRVNWGGVQIFEIENPVNSDSDDTDTVDRLVTEAVGRIIKRGLITFCDTLNNFPKD